MELTDKPELSLVIPVYNEEANLSELIRRTLAACDPMGISYEMILVDDGSADNSAQMIREAAEKNGGKVRRSSGKIKRVQLRHAGGGSERE